MANSRLPGVVRLFVWVTAGLTVLCGAVEVLCGLVLRWGYPYNWPVMRMDDLFRDFYAYQERFAFFHSAAFFTFPGEAYLYPAPPAMFYRLFFSVPHSTEVFLGAMSAAFFVAAIGFVRALVARGVRVASVVGMMAAVVLCSYAFFFEFRQANIEWIVWVFVMLGIWGFLAGRGYGAAACFGIAGSLKFYPLVFVGLLIARRQYRQAVAGVAVFAGSMGVSLWLLCPDVGVSWRGTAAGLALFRTRYVLALNQVGFDHSLFALGKAMHLGVPGPGMLTGYLAVMGMAATALYVGVIRRLPVVNQVVCLTVLSIVLPPVSYDYTLIHLYAPWALLVLVAVEVRGAVAGLAAAMVCLAVLLAPETEAILHGQSYGGQVKAVALVALLGVAVWRRFPSRWDVAAA